MRLKNKKHKHFTHRQQKIPRTKTTKKKNKQQQQYYCHCHYYHRIRVHYTVLTQHTTPTNNTQPNRSCLHKGVINRTTSVALDTQQHAIQTKQTIKTRTQTRLPKTPPTNKAERPQKAFVLSIPKPHTRTQHMRTHKAFPTKKPCHQPGTN